MKSITPRSRLVLNCSVFSFVALFIFIPLQAQADVGPLSREQAHLAVWKIHNVQPGERWGDRPHNRGTTVQVESRLFITNAHVLRGLSSRGATLSELRLSQRGSRDLTVKRVISISEVYDLALFETHEEGHGYLRLADNAGFDQLTRLAGLGHVNGVYRELAQRGVPSYEDSFSYLVAIAVSTEFGKEDGFLAGTSGGPIVNANGEIVGVMTQSSYNIAMAVRVERLNNFLGGDEAVACGGLNDLQPCLLEAWRGLEKRTEDHDSMSVIARFQLWHHRKEMEQGHEFMSLLEVAADAGFAPARHDFAQFQYEQGDSGRYKWMKLASDQELPQAQYRAGYCEYRGYGVEKDVVSGKRLMRRAFRQGFDP